MNPKKRRKAREYIVKALYTWQISNNDILDVENQYLQIINTKKVEIKYFHELITNISINVKNIDKKIQLYLSRKKHTLGQIDKAILRLAFYEIYYRKDIPYKVSMNEGIELAKLFGAQNSHKFINGVLHQASKHIRINNQQDTKL
ncbi:Transcription antitermination protein NusB [Buchnera aphidicola (Pterocallis alni)]|uniref:transcription antitermination factor NusB n=1 Tax=Buchnera aphidicola TaxID=9 RepID=UPI003464434B